MSNNSNALKAGLWYTVSNILLKGLGIITAPIFNRLLSTEQVGSFSNIQAWIAILVVVTTLELSSSVNLAVFDFGKEDIKKYLFSITLLGNLITLPFWISTLIFKGFWIELLQIEYRYIQFVFFILMVTPATTNYITYHRALLSYKQTVCISMINTLLSVAVSMVLILCLPNRLDGRVFGTYLPQLLIGIIIYCLIAVQGKTIDFKHWKYAFEISFPLAIHLLSGTVLNTSDRIMITRYCGNTDNAMYSVAYLIVSIVLLVWNSINGAWAPWCFMKFSKDEYDSVRLYSKGLFRVCAVLFTLVCLVAPEFMLFFGGEEYLAASIAVPPVMGGCLVVVAYSFYVNIEQFHKKQSYIALGTLIAALANYVLNLVFIPRYGYVAAAYTTLVGYILLYVFHLFITHRVIQKGDVYDTRSIMVTLTIAVGAILLTAGLRTYYIVRYSIIALAIFAFMLLMLKNKKTIQRCIKEKQYFELVKLFHFL